MDVSYCGELGRELRETVRTAAAADHVEGIMLLSTPSEALHDDAFESLLRSLEVPIVGGIFPELLYRGEKRTEGAVTIELSVEPDVTTIPALSDPTADYADVLDPALLTADYQSAFVFVDAYATEIERFIDSLFRTYGVDSTFLGGGAGTLETGGEPCLFTNEGVVADAAVFAAVEEPIEVGVNHGWQEIAGPFRVTDADGPTVHTLDGRPALAVYREVVRDHVETEITDENFFDVAKAFPFGIARLDGEQIVRDPFTVTEDGGLTCFGDVPAGEFVSILQGATDDLVAAAERAARDARAEVAEPAALLFFDCISRVLYLEEAFDRELAAVCHEEVPVHGALTIGEIANDGAGHLDYYNKTAVVGALEQL